MYTTNMFRHLVWGAMVLGASQAQGQATVPGNNGGFGDFLGWDAFTFQALEVRHDGNYPIDWYTDAVHRMRLQETVTYGGLGSFSNVVGDGYIGLAGEPSFFSSAPGAFSRLHLAHSDAGFNTTDIGYRPWMQNGITFTGNGDQMYIGHKYTYNDPYNEHSGIAADYTDAVIQWSDNPGTWLGDRMRFIFTSEYSSASGGNSSLEGLEGMQLFPVESGTEIFVGIGDWFGFNAQPEARLDVLNGFTRLRQLPTDPSSPESKVVVVGADGTLRWRPFTDFIEPAATDCDWTVSNANTSGTTTPHHVYTAVGTDDLCPDATDNVGVGFAAPQAKLDILANTADNVHTLGMRSRLFAGSAASTGGIISVEGAGGISGSTRTGLSVISRDADFRNAGMIVSASTNFPQTLPNVSNTGLSSTAEVGASGSTTLNQAGVFLANYNGLPANTQNYGVWSRATGGALFNRGVYGECHGAQNSPLRNVGLWGTALGSSNTNWGVYGYAPINPLANTDFAGFFQGNTWVSNTGFFANGMQTISDGTLKTNVQPLEDASAILAQLAPKTYEYIAQSNPFLDLAPGVHAGLISQDVELLLPDLVSEMVAPADYDSLGNEIAASRNVKALNYTGLIPYLVAAFNEQNARMSQLEQELAACCTAIDIDATPRSMQDGSGDLENDLFKADTRLTIAPNPFQEQTTISYTLEGSSRVQLQVSNQGGLHIATLRDQQQEEGAYSLTWHTADLAQGTYIVTLFSDGAPVVKRAVKVR